MNTLKYFSNEILITLISLLVSALIFLIKNYFSHLCNELKEVLKKVELIHIDVKSMDYAMEKSDKNGYQNYRDEEKSRLLVDSNFIKK